MIVQMELGGAPVARTHVQAVTRSQSQSGSSGSDVCFSGIQVGNGQAKVPLPGEWYLGYPDQSRDCCREAQHRQAALDAELDIFRQHYEKAEQSFSWTGVEDCSTSGRHSGVKSSIDARTAAVWRKHEARHSSFQLNMYYQWYPRTLGTSAAYMFVKLKGK